MSKAQFVVKYQYARTFVVIAAWISMGLFSELTGPTLPYLKHRIGGNYETISRPLAARSVGFLLGALLGGVLCAKLMKFADHILAVVLVIAGVVTCLAPYTAHWATLAICFCFDGISKGVIAVSASMVILQMWGEKATMPNTALHFAFGIGALTSPQLVRPFIVHGSFSTNTNIPSATIPPIESYESTPIVINNSDFGNNSETAMPDVWFLDAPIQYPYIIVSVITFINALIFWLCYFMDTPEIKTPQRDRKDAASGSLFHRFHPNSCFGEMGSNVVAFTLPAAYLFIGLICTGEERAFGKFLFSYAVDSPVHIPPERATILDSTFWACFTAGRGLATVASFFVQPLPVIGFCMVVNLSSTIILAVFGSAYPLATWIGAGVFGASMSPLFPVAMAWMNSIVGFSSTAASVSFIANAMGAFLFSWLAGYLFQYYGPDSLTCLLSVSSCLCFIAVVVMALLIRSVAQYKLVTADRETALAENKQEMPECEQPLDGIEKDNACV